MKKGDMYYKFRSSSEAEGCEFQELIFKLGGAWRDGLQEVRHPEAPAYFCERGRIVYSPDASDWDTYNQQCVEITLPELRTLVRHECFHDEYTIIAEGGLRVMNTFEIMVVATETTPEEGCKHTKILVKPFVEICRDANAAQRKGLLKVADVKGFDADNCEVLVRNFR